MPTRADVSEHLIFDPVGQPDGTTKYFLVNLPTEMHWTEGVNRHNCVTVDGNRLRVVAENGRGVYARATDPARRIAVSALWYLIEGEIDTTHTGRANLGGSLIEHNHAAGGYGVPPIPVVPGSPGSVLTDEQRRLMEAIRAGQASYPPGASGYAIQQLFHQANARFQPALSGSPFLQNAVAAAANPRVMPVQRTFEQREAVNRLRVQLTVAGGARDKARLRARIEDEELANSERFKNLVETRVFQGVERVVELSLMAQEPVDGGAEASLLAPLIPFLSALASGLRGMTEWRFEMNGKECAAGVDHPSSIEGAAADDRGREEWPLSRFFAKAAETAGRLHAQACRVRDLKIAKVAKQPVEPYASVDLNLGPYPDFPHVPDPGRSEF